MTWEILVPVLSTAHIKPETSNWLKQHTRRGQAMVITVAEYPEGYFIGPLQGIDELGKAELRLTYFGVPEDLLNLLVWAARKGYYWVRLDCAGDTVEELPTFEWEVKL